MKKIYILILCIFVVLLSSCGKKEVSTLIDFDNYRLTLHTDVKYIQEQDTSNIPENIQHYLLKLYTIKEEITFNDNIMILKMNNSYQDIENFVEKNTKDITRPSFELNKEKKGILDNCKIKIPLITQQALFENEYQPYYFIQSFFLDGNFAYIISAGTTTKKRANQLYSDFRSLTCKQ